MMIKSPLDIDRHEEVAKNMRNINDERVIRMIELSSEDNNRIGGKSASNKSLGN